MIIMPSQLIFWKCTNFGGAATALLTTSKYVNHEENNRTLIGPHILSFVANNSLV